MGYWEDCLPFCATDRKTGELTGALKDWCLKNADIRFEAVPYPTTDAALTAMKNGEIDCVFPVNLSSRSHEAIMCLCAILRADMKKDCL